MSQDKTVPIAAYRVIPMHLEDELDRRQTAQVVPYESGMVYHPLLSSLAREGFCSDPEECVELLANHCGDIAPEHKDFAFATTPETCQGLDVNDLIECAAQDMHADWQERVTDECAGEIAIVQAALEALHDRLADFPSFRVDFTRVMSLPAPPEAA